MTRLTLLTGATGFVGRHVLSDLCRNGERIRIVSRSKELDLSKFYDHIESVVETPDLFDEDKSWWSEVCTGVDTVIHLAWYAEPGKYLQSSKNIDCLLGTLNLAKGAAAAGVRRFVGVGTCFEYDLDFGVLSVSTPLKPLSPYAGAKAAAYLFLVNWLFQQKIDFVWCRLFYLYGDGEDPRRLVPYIHERLSRELPAQLTSGKQIRDFMNVRDAAAQIVEVAYGDHSGAVNICSGIPITVRQLSEKIADEYGRRDLLRFNARSDNTTDPPCVVGICNL